MKKVVYRLKREDGESGESYGLQVEERGKCAAYIKGAFTEKSAGKKFIQLCKTHGVSAVHVRDVLADIR